MRVDIIRRDDPLAELYPRGIEQIAELRGSLDAYDAYVDKPEGQIAFAEMAIEAYRRVHQLFGYAGLHAQREVKRMDFGRCPVVEYQSNPLALGEGDTPGSTLGAVMTMQVHENHVTYERQRRGQQLGLSEAFLVWNFGVDLQYQPPGSSCVHATPSTALEHGGWAYIQDSYEIYLDTGMERAMQLITVEKMARMVSLLGTLTFVENRLYSLE